MRLFTLFLLATLVTISVLPTGVMADPPLIRKNAADLTSTEWTLFKDAWSHVSSAGLLGNFIDLHSEVRSQNGYLDPRAQRFLPWHRVFLAQFEKELHDYNGTTIPYWDWNEYDEGDLVGNPLVEHSADPDWGIWNFTPDVLTSSGSVMQVARHVGGSGGSIPTSEEYDFVDQRPVYWDGNMSNSFATRLQNMSDNVHAYVGGNMGGISTAPSDPVYWMHRAFVDKTWFDWEESDLNHSFNFSNESIVFLSLIIVILFMHL